MKKVDKTGEENYNSFGSKMIITKYINAHNINVYFPEYNWTCKHCCYQHFRDGKMRSPYCKTIYGIGYIGEGKYKVSEDEKATRVYKFWNHMLERCYDEKYIEKYPTYKSCYVCDEWHNFQNFAKWYEENYYEIEDERMCLDKDILIKGNKIYSPNTCIFVPNRINVLFAYSKKRNNNLPIGVKLDERRNVFYSYCYNYGKCTFLGSFTSPIEAFKPYKEFKEKVIKQVANEYRDLIPQKLYEAMYKWEVEIDD